MAECIYCNYDGINDPDPLPDLDDDEGWAEVAHDHDDECEWVLTRAHRRDLPVSNDD